jgi:CubicO group peptidase (beta-lactamase class C family)
VPAFKTAPDGRRRSTPGALQPLIGDVGDRVRTDQATPLGRGDVSTRDPRSGRARRTLAGVAFLLSAACAPPDTAPEDLPVAWEIRPAAAVDDGTTYWPDAQWRTALPAQVGLDSATMAALSRDVRSQRWSSMRSLLIVRRGYLVFNEYVQGTTPDQLQDMQSMTTTPTGLLAGIAVREGKLRVEGGITVLFPEYRSVLESNLKQAITIDHLLTMRSALNWIEESSQGSSLQALNRSSGDWLQLIFGSAMVGTPGEAWRYSSGDAVALGGVLHATTGESANQYARRMLFAPLGITEYTWFTGSPDGLPQTGTGLALTAPDMARIGYLMLRKGQWKGAPIVTEQWVASMRERKSREAVFWRRYPLDFGRMLWVLPSISGSGDVGVFAGSGTGGQWIIVVPSKDLVVVATGDAGTVDDHAIAMALLYDVILPAAR